MSAQSDLTCRAGKTAKTAPVSKANAGLRITVVALGLAVLGACAPVPAPLPPPPPPPPPPVEVIPYRPIPPSGAAYVMNIPPLGPDGKRMTVNRGLSADEQVWHFRSGWNVAALNCSSAQYDAITAGYTRFIQDYAEALKAVNDRIVSVYQAREPSRRDAIIARQGVMTSVYNFFALPPARASFCRETLDISNRLLAAPQVDPITFAQANSDQLQRAFENFFNEYAAYQQQSAEWDAKYGAQYGPSQPGWVAVQEARARGVIVPSLGSGAADPGATLSTPKAVAGTVEDADTGAEVPIIPVQDNVISQPVVEPIQTQPSPPQGEPQ